MKHCCSSLKILIGCCLPFTIISYTLHNPWKKKAEIFHEYNKARKNLNYICGYQEHSRVIINSLAHCSWDERWNTYEVVSETSRNVIAVTALLKDDEGGGQDDTSKSLLDQPATWHHAVNMHCFYTCIFHFMFRFVYNGSQNPATCLHQVLHEAR
jgi:hypothetical protein